MSYSRASLENALDSLKIGYSQLRHLSGYRQTGLMDNTYVVQMIPEWASEHVKSDFEGEGRLLNVVHDHMQARGFETPRMLEQHVCEHGIVQLRSLVGHPDKNVWPAQDGGWENGVVGFLAALHSVPRSLLEQADAAPGERVRQHIAFNVIESRLACGSSGDAQRAREALQEVKRVFNGLSQKAGNTVLLHNDFAVHNIAVSEKGQLQGAWDFGHSVMGDFALECFPVAFDKLPQARAAYSQLTGRNFCPQQLVFYEHALLPLHYMSVDNNSGEYGLARQVLELAGTCRRVAPQLMAAFSCK